MSKSFTATGRYQSRRGHDLAVARCDEQNRPMNVVVCVKQIPDPAEPGALDPNTKTLKREGKLILDESDSFGVEMALQLAESTGGGEVTLVSMGPEVAMAAIRKGLSMGAHSGVLITDPALRGADALATARVLAAAIGRRPFDLVLTGVESTDGYTGTLPMAVAELLGVPSATFARKVQVDGSTLRTERQTDLGYDVIECALPALATVTGSGADPRYATLKGIMAAKSKPVEQLTLADLGLSAADVAPTQRVTGVTPTPTKGAGEVIEAGEDAAARIADFLSEAKVV